MQADRGDGLDEYTSLEGSMPPNDGDDDDDDDDGDYDDDGD